MNIPKYREALREVLNTLAVECAFGVIDREDLPRLVGEAEAQILQATKELVLGLVGKDRDIPHAELGSDGYIRPFVHGQNELRADIRNAIAEMGEK